MQFGLYTPLPHVNYPEGWCYGPDADPWYHLALDTVTAADQAGFSITLVAQRYLGLDLEAWVLSGALAQATRRIEIMTAFHPAFWTPQVLARMTTSLDRISGGRAALNLVTGWWQEEHDMYGADMLAGDDRYARAEEQVAVLRRLWSEEAVTHHGRFYQLDDVRLQVRPMGRLPLVYGASRSERGLEMIARCCDWWFVPYENDFRKADENLARMPDIMADIGERAARHGRTVRFCTNALVILDEDEAAARRAAEALEAHGRLGAIERVHQHGLGTGLIGGRGRIQERIARLEAIGIEMVLIKPYPVLDCLHRFAEQVLEPGLNAAAGTRS